MKGGNMKKVLATSLFLFLTIFSSATSTFALSLEATTNSNAIQTDLITIKDWDATMGTQYYKGEIVTDGIMVKEVLQDFTANGDENWFEASSLFGNSIPYDDVVEIMASYNADSRLAVAVIVPFLVGIGVGWMADAIYNMGGYASCRSWNDSNWVMDWYCDSNGWHAD
jgi:hypothetical protein